MYSKKKVKLITLCLTRYQKKVQFLKRVLKECAKERFNSPVTEEKNYLNTFNLTESKKNIYLKIKS